ncbi:Dus domain-containing protein [Rhizoctonia solani AG-1 IA]|uniref:tRNA-dihydrouridine(16/17) synthase [NAD(P)(+)] n=1 Tax=Thanatephorus cucumeris (strain AG1-IA) TaxID=983506 RepID=L8WMX0_THACA|nr:Dus domain-containing protein [Rhizoctonia solani AG-1 IA]
MTATESSVSPPTGKLGGYGFYEKVLKSPKYVVAPMVDQSELVCWSSPISESWLMVGERHGGYCPGDMIPYTPMINSKMFAGNHRRGYQELNFNIANGEEGGDRDRPLIVQKLLDSALVVQDHCDAVDINFGCPQDIAKKGHYGSFLQDDWDLVYKLSKLIAVDYDPNPRLERKLSPVMAGLESKGGLTPVWPIGPKSPPSRKRSKFPYSRMEIYSTPRT